MPHGEQLVPDHLLSKIVEQRAALMRIKDLSERALKRPDSWLEVMREINKIVSDIKPIGDAVPGPSQGRINNPEDFWDFSKSESRQRTPRPRETMRGGYLDLEAAARRELVAKYAGKNFGGRA